MNIKTRLLRLERADRPAPVVAYPSLAAEIDRRVAEDLARQEARRAKIDAALAGDDPERRAWAQREFERDAAFEALPEEEQLRLDISCPPSGNACRFLALKM